MASELDIDAIEQRANAATEGPWDFWIRLTPDVSRVLVGTHDKPTLSGALPQVAISMEIAKLPTRINPSGNFMHNRDAEFIAHARTDIPALIARVRELEAIIEATARESECVSINADVWIQTNDDVTGKPWLVMRNNEIVGDADSLWDAIEKGLADGNTKEPT